MKILQINSVYGIRSTGRIVTALESLMDEAGIEHCAISGEGKTDAPHVHNMSGRLYLKLNILKTRLFGKHGFYNKRATRKALKFIEREKPDLIHLHNIHGHYINIKLLFEYIKKKNIPVVWTLHDCWSFTGHCPHFDYIGCEKWKTECHHCPQKRGYPDSWLFDRSRENYGEKKELFTSLENINFVPVSEWLEKQLKMSFLKDYPSKVIRNGVDVSAFCHRDSDLRTKLGLEDKFLIMGVIKKFSGPKGGEHFLKLSEMLAPDEHIVLLTLDEKHENIPSNITALPTTNSKEELSRIYSMVDVFVNPSFQESLSMVNMEAVCCSTPVVSFDSGGCGETVDETCGILVKRGDTEGLYEGIKKVRRGELSMEHLPKIREGLQEDRRFAAYIDLYREILGE